MKTLKLKNFKAEMVLDGVKNSTIRLFDDKDLKAGDLVELINSDTGEKIAQAKIISADEKKLDELTDTDLEGHEKWNSAEEMYANFRKYYGDSVGPETIAKIIRFKLKK